MTPQRTACYNFVARHIAKSRSPRGRVRFAFLLNTSALYRINSKFARPYLKFWNNAQNMVIFYGQAIERGRKTERPVLVMSQKEFRNKLNRLCAANGLPEVGVHGLRHSLASLAASLNFSERATMLMGGWDDIAISIVNAQLALKASVYFSFHDCMLLSLRVLACIIYQLLQLRKGEDINYVHVLTSTT